MTKETETYIDAQGRTQTDRRVNHRVRSVFDRAWVLLEPMLDGARDKPGGASGFALAVALRGALPELTPVELNLLVSTAMRVRRERRVLVPRDGLGG
jgi:hypothetical protein